MLNTNTSELDVVEAWPYDFQRISNQDPLYEYLGVYANELQRVDLFIDELYEQRFLESATTRELGKLSEPLGVVRRAGEDDDTLRYRAQLEKLVASSDGTAETIEGIIEAMFGTDALSTIEVVRRTDTPIIEFRVPSNLITDAPLGEAEMESLLERAFPCGSRPEIVTDDTFAFAEQDGTAPSYGAGFGQGSWSV